MEKQQRKMYKHVSASTSEDTLDKLDEQLLEGNEEPPPGKRSQRRHIYIAALVVVIAVSAIFGFILGTRTATSTAPTTPGSLQATSHGSVSEAMVRITDCGESPTEAKEMGCKFDLMLQRWIPADCYDEAHSELFLARYPRKWYYDIDLKHEMDDATVRSGEHRMTFTPSDYHKRHCSYTWELTSRALQEQRPLLDELISFTHTHHCNGILLGPEWNATEHDGRPKPTEVDPGYLRCAPYSIWLQDMPE
ncbi:hypothetical protein F4819DRAFT_459169 [Hypoxylon fuscum]|nr:hypothetical protein F4819DRAFT_459169 [Hypoxylon fuscum]